MCVRRDAGNQVLAVLAIFTTPERNPSRIGSIFKNYEIMVSCSLTNLCFYLVHVLVVLKWAEDITEL